MGLGLGSYMELWLDSETVLVSQLLLAVRGEDRLEDRREDRVEDRVEDRREDRLEDRLEDRREDRRDQHLVDLYLD